MRCTAFLSSSSSRASALPLIGWLSATADSTRSAFSTVVSRATAMEPPVFRADECLALTEVLAARYRIEE